VILVDTSVWVDHLRCSDDVLIALLGQNTVLMHPMIIGELACGNLKNRQELMLLWRNLPGISTASDDEAIIFLERNQLMGKGIGYVDLHLLTAVVLQKDAILWARDKRLNNIAHALKLGFTET
jgi:predicted nucleic acid-binding protein